MIKLVVFDFDGVFTDGKIIFDNNGYAFKFKYILIININITYFIYYR